MRRKNYCIVITKTNPLKLLVIESKYECNEKTAMLNYSINNFENKIPLCNLKSAID